MVHNSLVSPTLLSRAAILLIMAVAGCSSPPVEAAPPGAPNFLFLALDDLIPVTAGHIDEPGSLLRTLVPNRAERHALSRRLTPNMNRLAARGLTFTQAWTNYPLCCPSRGALLTGIAASRSHYIQQPGVPLHDPRSPLRNAITLPERLRLAGYDTLGLGKIFHFSHANGPGPSGDWPDIERSWTSWLSVNAGVSGAREEARRGEGDRIRFGRQRSATAQQPDWINAEIAADVLLHGAAETVNELNQPASLVLQPDRPFFLALGLRTPHTPWQIPPVWLSHIRRHVLRSANINLRAEADDLADLRGLNLVAASKRMRETFGYGGRGTEGPTRRRLLEGIRYQLATIAFADACIGRVLDALAASPYAQNTVVVLWSDHGFSLGQKLHLGKSSLWEPSLDSELIIADPRAQVAGNRRERIPVSLLDIYPTVCEIAGVDHGRDCDGLSLARAVWGGRAPRGRTVTASFQAQRVIRQGDWKYITYGPGNRGDELYHLGRDPLERHNLLFQPNAEMLGIASRLRREIHH